MVVNNGNGQGRAVDLRKTHPNLYRLIVVLACVNFALGGNFLAFTPTFFVYGMPNALWAGVFLGLGASFVFFTSVVRNLRLVRATLGVGLAYILAFGIGTMQPALEGKGSLQLSILYFAVAAIKAGLLREPYINPWTAKTAKKD